MTHIHLILPFYINEKDIPKHASTHYAYNVHQTVHTTPKTKKGFARKPITQRKTIKNARPLAVTQPVSTPVATPKAKKQRTKFRKNIKKPALTTYFDNDARQTRADAVQQWQNAVVAELGTADKISAQNAYNLQADIEHRYNALGIKNFNYATNLEILTMSQADFDKLVNTINFINQSDTEPEYGIWDEYDIAPNDDIYFCEFDVPELNNRTNNPTEFEEDDDFYLFADTEPQYPHRKSLYVDLMEQERAEINESTAARFTNKYNGADTAAAMRAFEKQKFHSTPMAYILHKMQITK